MNDVGLNREIVPQKLGRMRGVGENATDFCGCQKYELGTVFAKKFVTACLIPEVQLGTAADQQVVAAERF